MNGDHWDDLDLRGASEVHTPVWLEVETRIREALLFDKFVFCGGRCGTGKSFIVRHVAAAIAAEFGYTLAWVENTPHPTARESTKSVGTALGHTLDGTRDSLTDDVLALLADAEKVLLVEDEVQKMMKSGLAHVRFMVEQTRGRVPLILIGGPGSKKTLKQLPEVRSRIARGVAFRSIPHASLITTLHEWHPALESVPAATLCSIDTQWADGNWRRWAEVLSTALFYAQASKDPSNLKPHIRTAVQAAQTVDDAINATGTEDG